MMYFGKSPACRFRTMVRRWTLGASAAHSPPVNARGLRTAAWGMTMTAVVSLLSVRAQADPPRAPDLSQPPVSTTEKNQLDTVTIEASRQRKELERQVSHFVSSVPVHYSYESMARWNTPICPLVAGLTRDQGELVLTRISQIVTASQAPLAAVHCPINFYIVISREPDTFLKEWRARDPNMFSRQNGGGYIKTFVESRRPVRVWYNSDLGSADAIPTSPADVALSPQIAGPGLGGPRGVRATANTVRTSTRLSYGAIRNLSTVIVIVDSTRTEHLSLIQVADYVAMVGLAEINPDADVDVGTAPTILRLFQNTETPPVGLSTMDQAFLTSLYATNQESVWQSSAMKRDMLNSIAP
jgi:hypothetical protein